jgi:hypothetical protein
MGFTNESSRNFVKVNKGKFLIPNPKGETIITNDNGTEGRFDAFNTFRGVLLSIKKSTGQYGDQWFFEMVNSEGETYTIALKFDSLTAQGFLNSLCSVTDFSKELRLTTSSKELTSHPGKYRSSIWVWEGAKNVEWAHELKDLPPGEDILDKKGNVVGQDYSARMDFWEAQANDINRRVEAPLIGAQENSIQEVA